MEHNDNPNFKELSFSFPAIAEANSIDLADYNLDLRPLKTGYTISTFGSRDLDIGVNIRKENNTYYFQLYVVDVAEIVKPETALFKEMFDKFCRQHPGNVFQSILPAPLSQNLLSFIFNQRTPAIEYDFVVDEDLSVSDLKISEVMFLSDRSLTFDEFDEIIGNNASDPEFKVLSTMYEFGEKLLASRIANGELVFYDLDNKLFTDEEGKLLKFAAERDHLGYIALQEMEIFANKNLAILLSDNDYPVLYRNHAVRLIAPERSEITSMYALILQQEANKIQLLQKYTLWFNPVTYDVLPVNHFGLNSTAYVQANLPGRRYVDLVNQLQIKTLINEQEPIFSYADLAEMVEKIKNRPKNQSVKKKITKKKKGTAKLVKLKDETRARMAFKNEKNKIRQVIKASLISNILAPGLLNSIEDWYARGLFDVNHMYLALFGEKERKGAWIEIIQYLLEIAHTRQGIPNQLLQIAIQRNTILSAIEPEYVQKENIWHSKINGTIDGKVYTTKDFYKGYNKRNSLHEANYVFLVNYLKNFLGQELR